MPPIESQILLVHFEGLSPSLSRIRAGYLMYQWPGWYYDDATIRVLNKQMKLNTAYWGYTLSLARFACMNRHSRNFAPLFTSLPPVYSGKYRSNGTCETKMSKIPLDITFKLTFGNFPLKTSILFKKRMIDVRRNHRELMTESKRTRDSAMRF